MRAGFGLWLDYNSGRDGWHPDGFDRNHLTPDGWRRAVSAALAQTDRYVWIYSERVRWWEGTVPREYVEAQRQASRDAAVSAPLSTTPEPR
jgi:hypothetical protein